MLTFFRAYRPEPPLLAWVKQQAVTVYVSRKDYPALVAGGADNIQALPHGGPMPGEAWLLHLELVDRG